jgi:UDP-N-acetylglucosamine 2-epimerase (non-hydrolysing)
MPARGLGVTAEPASTRPRNVAFFAGTRADLWPLSPVLHAMTGAPARTRLLMPADVASRLGDQAVAVGDSVELSLLPTPGCGERDAAHDHVRRNARLSEDVSAVFDADPPDLVVILGDRYELLGVAAAATLHRVPIVHLSGGEITTGAIDDAVRHALTKLSHLHLCTTEVYAARVRSMGEERWRVHVVGEPGLDRLEGLLSAFQVRDLEAAIGVELQRPVGLLTYHPPTLAPPGEAARELDALLLASSALPTVIATHPGPDLGSRAIIEALQVWSTTRAGAVVVHSLGELFPRALAEADVVLGNSSSGIIEAPSLAVPVVNVGKRQDGRVRWPGVIDVGADADEVRRAIDRALDPAFRDAARAVPNPFGDGHAAPRIVRLLLDQPLDDLLHKRFAGDDD